MYMWDEIVRDPEYQRLSDKDKFTIRAGWFRENLLDDPDYNALTPEEKSKVMRGFLDEEKKVQAAPYTPHPTTTPSKMEEEKGVILSPLAEPIVRGFSVVERQIRNTIGLSGNAFKELGAVFNKVNSVLPAHSTNKELTQRFGNALQRYGQSIINFYAEATPAEKAAKSTFEARSQAIAETGSKWRKYDYLLATGITDTASYLYGVTQFSKALSAGAEAGQLLKASPSVLQRAFATMRRVGTHGFVTSSGDTQARLENGLWKIGYNITPFIAGATGLQGLKAMGTDIMLNMFLSSPTYAKALSESKNFDEFAERTLITFAGDVVFAHNTRGFPELARNKMASEFIKGRPDGMSLPEYMGVIRAIDTELGKAEQYTTEIGDMLARDARRARITRAMGIDYAKEDARYDAYWDSKKGLPIRPDIDLETPLHPAPKTEVAEEFGNKNFIMYPAPSVGRRSWVGFEEKGAIINEIMSKGFPPMEELSKEAVEGMRIFGIRYLSEGKPPTAETKQDFTKFDMWINARKKEQIKWAHKNKLSIDDSKWDDQTKSRFDKHLEQVGLADFDNYTKPVVVQKKVFVDPQTHFKSEDYKARILQKVGETKSVEEFTERLTENELEFMRQSGMGVKETWDANTKMAIKSAEVDLDLIRENIGKKLQAVDTLDEYTKSLTDEEKALIQKDGFTIQQLYENVKPVAEETVALGKEITEEGGEFVTKTTSKVYGYVTDQTSLEKIGNQIKEIVGIEGDIKWIYKTTKRQWVNATAYPKRNEIVFRVPTKRIDDAEVTRLAKLWAGKESGRLKMITGGKERVISTDLNVAKRQVRMMENPSQASIKKIIAHELLHFRPDFRSQRVRGVMHPSGFHEATGEVVSKFFEKTKVPKALTQEVDVHTDVPIPDHIKFLMARLNWDSERAIKAYEDYDKTPDGKTPKTADGRLVKKTIGVESFDPVSIMGQDVKLVDENNENRIDEMYDEMGSGRIPQTLDRAYRKGYIDYIRQQKLEEQRGGVVRIDKPHIDYHPTPSPAAYVLRASDWLTANYGEMGERFSREIGYVTHQINTQSSLWKLMFRNAVSGTKEKPGVLRGTESDQKLFMRLIDTQMTPNAVDKLTEFDGMQVTQRVKNSVRMYKEASEGMRQERIRASNLRQNWGIQWGHYPHVFKGEFVIQTQQDDGSWKQISSKKFPPRLETEYDAAYYLAQYQADHPDEIVRIEYDPYSRSQDDLIRLSRNKFFTVIGRVENKTHLTADDAYEILKGTIGLRSKKYKHSPYLEHRQGYEGWKDKFKDYNEVMDMYVEREVRSIYLTKLYNQLAPEVETIGQSNPQLGRYMQDLLDGMWGKTSKVDEACDTALRSIPEIGKILPAGTTHRILNTARQFRIICDLENLGFWALNRYQPYTTVVPYTGWSPVLRAEIAEEVGFGLTGKAGLYNESNLPKIMKDAIAFVKEENVGYVDLSKFGSTPKWRLSSRSEASVNRRGSMAYYIYAKEKLGMEEDEARKYALYGGIFKSNFAPFALDPQFLRAAGSPGKLAFLYKKYGISMLGQMLELKSKGNYKGLAWMAMSQVLAGGIKVITNPLVGMGTATFFGTEWGLNSGHIQRLRKRIEEAVGEKGAAFAMNGLAGLIGIDLSNRFNSIPIQPPFREGHFISESLFGVIGTQVESWANTIRRLGEEEPKSDVLMQATAENFGYWGRLANTIYNIYKHDSLQTSEGLPVVRTSDISSLSLGLKLCGFQPMELTQIQELVSAKRYFETSAINAKHRMVNHLYNYTETGNGEYVEKFLNTLSDYNSKYSEFYPLSGDDIIKGFVEKVSKENLTLMERHLKKSAKGVRPWFIRELSDMINKEKRHRGMSPIGTESDNERRRRLGLPLLPTE